MPPPGGGGVVWLTWVLLGQGMFAVRARCRGVHGDAATERWPDREIHTPDAGVRAGLNISHLPPGGQAHMHRCGCGLPCTERYNGDAYRGGDLMMGDLVTKPSLTDRMIRAARLETGLYNEVEADLSATNQALTVVIVAALAGGIGAALGQAMAGRPTGVVGGLIGGIIAELVGWLVWSYVMYLVGTRVFHGTATYGELLRTLGFANSPGVLLILRFVPLLGGLITLIVDIWRIVEGFIAVREALDLDNGNTVATIVVGIIAYLVVLVIVALVLGTIGLGAAVLTGGLG